MLLDEHGGQADEDGQDGGGTFYKEVPPPFLFRCLCCRAEGIALYVNDGAGNGVKAVDAWKYIGVRIDAVDQVDKIGKNIAVSQCRAAVEFGNEQS